MPTDAMHKSQASGFVSTASVKLNAKTGKIEGWDSLFALVDTEDSGFNMNKIIDHDKVVDRLAKGTFKVEQVDNQNFLMIDTK